MDFTQNSCREFVEVLASSAPVPGGGGASALVAAIGTALGNMIPVTLGNLLGGVFVGFIVWFSFLRKGKTAK